MPTTNGFTHTEKQPGDLIQSADWNAAMAEVERLEGAKVNKNGVASLQGPLTIAEALQVSDDLSVNGDTTLNGTLTTTGNTSVGGTLSVTDSTTLNHTLNVSSDTDVGGALTVAGNADLGSNLNVAGDLEVSGAIRANAFVYTNPMRHRMFPGDPLVYQDIFEAREAGAISKLGSPSYDDTGHNTTSKLWNKRRIIAYGGNSEADGNGAEVTIPEGYDTVWVRVLGERWNVIKAYFLDGNKEALGLWTGGRRDANCYCPDGSLSDSYYDAHQWVPIPAGRSGRLALISKPNTSGRFWLSGLAFSRNPWAHATQSALGYHWQVNGGEETNWPSDGNSWNDDILTYLGQNTNYELKVPVVRSGRDKLLYIIEHNNYWNGCMHTGVTVNSTPIERFISTYDTPFARHWNSKIYQRYIAARIPADLIGTGPTVDYLSVRVDMSKQNNHIHFREIGTHDFDIPTLS